MCVPSGLQQREFGFAVNHDLESLSGLERRSSLSSLSSLSSAALRRAMWIVAWVVLTCVGGWLLNPLVLPLAGAEK